MNTAIFLLYAAGHFALFGWALLLLLRHGRATTVPLLIVTAGLVYDNLMLAAGSSIGAGEQLRQLSVPRFFLHAVATPLLILSGLGLARRAGSRIVRSRAVAAAVLLLTLAMVAVGFRAEMLSLELVLEQTGGIVRYGNGATDGPPLAPVVTILLLIAAGLLVWRSGGGPWLAAASLAQFAAAAIGDAILVAGNFGELLLLAGLVATDWALGCARPEPAHAGSSTVSTASGSMSG